MSATFLRAFFRRPTNLIRERYGDTAYIDATGFSIEIADAYGPLGGGDTLKEAMAAADIVYKTRFPLCANCCLVNVSDPDDRYCIGCKPYVRAMA